MHALIHMFVCVDLNVFLSQESEILRFFLRNLLDFPNIQLRYRELTILVLVISTENS